MALTQNEKNKKWRDKNKKHNRYLSYRSTSRSFIRKLATADDLKELINLIEERSKEIGKEG
ncbi:hypothetical protein [Fructobacillus papyrifericola]|uniref:Uncharacterized protein n=1 Tax=Fructobacillus papyrifericola TaxID=2713172 RepID=A0ABS5QT70_9LACO|nr:hypothetical protein [Fructobacillus papyrifericola]MBS9336393.1 hypothetical protein [Fructobacillus papyrifericola]